MIYLIKLRVVVRLVFFFKPQRERIDAEALASRFAGTVGEDVPQVTAAISADHFHPAHAVGVIIHILHSALNALVKTWPPALRVKFAIAFKELRSAVGTGVGAIRAMAQIFSAKRPLGGFSKQHGFLFTTKVRVLFLFHGNSILKPIPKASGLQSLVKPLFSSCLWKGAK